MSISELRQLASDDSPPTLSRKDLVRLTPAAPSQHYRHHSSTIVFPRSKSRFTTNVNDNQVEQRREFTRQAFPLLKKESPALHPGSCSAVFLLRNGSMKIRIFGSMTLVGLRVLMLLWVSIFTNIDAWQVPIFHRLTVWNNMHNQGCGHCDDDSNNSGTWDQTTNRCLDRRSWLEQQHHRWIVLPTTTTAIVVASSTSLWNSPAQALVKGVPPPTGAATATTGNKCRNVEECQELAEKREREERATALANQEPISVTGNGVRYRDLQEGTGAKVQEGDAVVLHYKVLKLGKRSYDGLSGEGTVIFSRGYGLEDDESSPGEKSFRTIVGAYSNIVALNEALVGMNEGGVRRFAVLPPQGWRKPGRDCDGGPGGSGAGGDLKTDYVVVPTATMVAAEACFDMSKQPFPVSYAQQRRMAQRFDQSLIMEIQLVSVIPALNLNETPLL